MLLIKKCWNKVLPVLCQKLKIAYTTALLLLGAYSELKAYLQQIFPHDDLWERYSQQAKGGN